MALRFTILAALTVSVTGGCALAGRRVPAVQSVAGRDLSLQGMAAMEMGHWERAETLFRESIELSPADADARRYLAEALWRRGAAKEAIEQIEAAVAADAADAALAVRAGELQLAVGGREQALARAEQAIRLDPKLPAAWALRGRAFWQLNRTERALADFHRALEFGPQDPDLLMDVATLYRQIGQPVRSLSTLHRLLDACSPGQEPQQALYLQGLALADLDRPQPALDSFLAASQRGPSNVELLYQLARAHAAIGDHASASAALEQALAQDASHAPSRQLLAHLATLPVASGLQRQ
jgi:tetratricopeptide (TPR) repeat protein